MLDDKVPQKIISMAIGKIVDFRFDIIPTANKGFIVRFGEERRGRLAFESEAALFRGLTSYINDPQPWDDLIKIREGE